ncbi:MAG TPA: ATP-binding protein, partial [Anseongella sp.]|nr:ATP-binding protein [Anseongella sp.]
MINQLMDLAKLEAAALKPQLRLGRPDLTVYTVVESFQNEANSNVVNLVFPPAMEENYWFDPDMLEKIVYNLISNALKFTPKGGTVTVNLTREATGLKLIVQDTGIGIPAEKLPYIFDRFYQAENPAMPLLAEAKPAGTGIGLAFVKELTEVQGGFIEVLSKVATGGSASGTTFTVYFPYQKAEERPLPVYSKQPQETADTVSIESPAETLPLILVVEDNSELSGFITQSLSGLYRVHQAENGQTGLEAALTLMPDLVISDVLMPVMDGFTLCHQLKSDIRTSHIPVVLLTAKAARESRLEGLTQGADDYLTKPFQVQELLLRIQNLLLQQSRQRNFFKQQLTSSDLPSSEQQEPAPVNAFISALHTLVEDHLDDTSFGADELASLVNMSRTTLYRKIKALTGMTTTEFVRNYRLKRAARFLQEGFNSSEAAYKSGFNSPSYFTKSFREAYGKTPSEFIEQLK